MVYSLILLILGFILLTLQVSLVNVLFPAALQFDLLLWLTIFTALHHPPTGGAVLVFIWGLSADLASVGIGGFNSLAKVLIFALVLASRAKFYSTGLLFQVALGLVALLVQQVLLGFCLNLFDWPLRATQLWGWPVIIRLLVFGLFTPLVLAGFIQLTASFRERREENM